MSKRVDVLTYHSQNILGMAYASNDHVALTQDLLLLGELGIPVIRALDLAAALQRGSFAGLPQRSVVITLDDGSVFDYEDIDHPRYGPQESMLSILRRRHKTVCGLRIGRAPFTATAFVIGSKEARDDIGLGFDSKDWMTDSWWSAAQRTPYLDIGCHSWEHGHPTPAFAAAQPELVGAFHGVCSLAEAERQVGQASRELRAVTKSDAARLFAYPFGHTNDFLLREYLPRKDRVIAAFTTAGEPVTETTNRWIIPRFVCGDHWKSADQLRSLLTATP